MRQYLRVGDAAPSFLARDQHGRLHSLDDFRGSWLVLYFYPKDRTMHCTQEACGFRDERQAFAAEDATIVGVSRDDQESHRDFTRRNGLDFLLLSDSDGSIMRAYQAEGWFGVPARISYIIDPDGHVAQVYPHVNARTHSAAVLSDLHELRTKRGSTAPEQPLAAV